MLPKGADFVHEDGSLTLLHEDIPFPTAPIVLYDPTGSENRAIK